MRISDWSSDVCSSDLQIDQRTGLAAAARAEGREVMEAAGIDRARSAEETARRGDLVKILPIDGATRSGGSTWQSIARGTGRVEVDQLNGEIVLLGRLHGVPTPLNAMLQQVGHELARPVAPPGSRTDAGLATEATRLGNDVGSSARCRW